VTDVTDRNALPTVHDTVVHMLQDASEHSPDAIALMAGATELSYRDYASSIATLAHRLVDLGAAGERIALVMGNSIDMAIAMFAIHAAGAQAVPINPLYTAREVQYILRDAAPVATFHDVDVAELISPLQDSGTRIAGGGNNFIAPGENTLPRPFPAADALATLQYTGGTTG
jgi:long-chain acyl-CoA synthetase